VRIQELHVFFKYFYLDGVIFLNLLKIEKCYLIVLIREIVYLKLFIGNK